MSTFLKVIRDKNTGELVTGSDVDLYEPNTANKLYDLVESSEVPGVYYKTSVSYGLYDIWVDGTKRDDYDDTPHLGSAIFSIADRFNGSYELQTAGIENAAITLDKLSAALVAYIDAGGSGSITNFPDDVTLEENGEGKLQIKDSGVTGAKIADGVINPVKMDDTYMQGLFISGSPAVLAVQVDDTTLELSGEYNVQVKAGGIDESHLGSGVVTEDKLGSGVVTEDKLGSGAVTVTKVGIGIVKASTFNQSYWHGMAAIDSDEWGVNVDDTTIEINVSEELQVKDGGIILAKMASNSVDTDQLVTNSVDGSAIDSNGVIRPEHLGVANWLALEKIDDDTFTVVVDDTTIQINGSNELEVIDGSIGTTQLSSGVNNTLANWTYVDASNATTTKSIAIGQLGSADASAILELVSSAKGFIAPVMSSTAREAISSPAEGLIVYDSTLHKLMVYTTEWETITSAVL